jgi:multimeric flavodoxin WrbA
MRVVILDGTHNKNGITMELINSFIAGLKTADPDAEVVMHDLLEEDIRFCLGCKQCTGKEDPAETNCTTVDACSDVKEDAFNSDVLVLATPANEYSVGFAMKRFLERCLSIATFNPRPAPTNGKKGVIMCTITEPFRQLSDAVKYPKTLLKQVGKMFKCDDMEYLFAGSMGNERFKERYLLKARSLGESAGAK